MTVAETEYRYFASCPRGVEDLLAAECAQLELADISASTGGVAFAATLEGGYRMCLWSRLASRVLLQLAKGQADDYEALYRYVQQLDWSQHITAHSSLAVDCFSSHKHINNSHYATLKIKDAIVDQFKQHGGQRPDVERERPDVRINVYISASETIIYLDLSGEPLHRRGYRRQTGEAPLKENLAAAILLRSKWPQLAAQGTPLCDPMCGSATLLIEAAYIAANIAPGLRREYYGFFGWQQHDPALWKAVYSEATVDTEQLDKLPLLIGADHSKKMIAIARENIQAAGLDAHIDVYLQDITRPLPQLAGRKGLLVTNPPYGKRIGQGSQLANLYYLLGQSLRNNYPGWTAAIFTASDDMARHIGLRSHHRNTLYNGALKCSLLHYQIRDALPETVAAGDKTEDVHENAVMFENRLKKNLKHLSRWARKNNISCYRLYDADIPQFAVAVDVYDGWVHVQEYEPPKTVNTAMARYRLNDAVSVIADVLQLDREHVAVKTRKVQSGGQQYQRQDQKQHNLVVTEAGLSFSVNLYDYLDTGLFLDHRNMRQLIYNSSKDRSFLNLFAYTCTATVYAAAGGARSTTSVDMSNTYLEWGRQNLKLNGLERGAHEFVRADILQWLWDARRAGQRYQLIFLDPPTFSNSTKMNRTLDIKRDHVELIDLAMRLLSKDGMLLFSCNARRFKLDSDALTAYVVQEITRLTTAEDFRRRPLHRAWVIAWEASAIRLQR